MPPALAGLAKQLWTLDCGGRAGTWLVHKATPDGCIEIIRRLSGRSRWRREQPALFAAGLSLAPAQLELSGDSRFIGLRLWPWAWRALGGADPAIFLDDWIALDPAASPGKLLAAPDAVLSSITEALSGIEPHPIARAVLRAGSVADLARLTGASVRTVQRWFADQVGIPPRTYLRLLRFDEALRRVQCPEARLAGEAAELGYADQPHMNRDFRLLAGHSPARARGVAKGPFLRSGPS